MKSTRYCIALACVLAAAQSTTAAAAASSRDTSYYIGGLVEFSDNLRRTYDNEIVGEAFAGLIGVDTKSSSRRIDSQLTLDLAYFDYSDDPGLSGPAGNAFGRLDFRIDPRRFFWFVEDAVGQTLLNGVQADTAANRENVNILRSGPVLRLPVGRRTELRLAGSFEKSSFEISNFDNEKLLWTGSVERRLTDRQTLSLNASATQTTFDRQDLYVDYDEREYYARWSSTGPKTRISAEAGRNSVGGGVGRMDAGTLLRFYGWRKLGRATSLSIHYRSDVTDVSTAYRIRRQVDDFSVSTGDASGAVGAAVVSTADIFNYKLGRLAYEAEGRRAIAGVALSWQREDYRQVLLNDRERRAIEGFFRLSVNPRWVVGIEGTRETVEYRNQPVSFSQWFASGVARAQLTPRLSMLFSASHSQRSGAIQGGAYAENAVRVAVFYSVGRGLSGLPDLAGVR